MITTGSKSGFEVCIQRPGGEAFNEYDVKQTSGSKKEPSVTSCWLESEKDAIFEIKCKIGTEVMRRNKPFDWTITVFVDGRIVSHDARRHNMTEAGKVTTTHMTFMEDGSAYEGRLKFANLRTTDNDEEVTIVGDQLQALGKIRVDFSRGTMGELYKESRIHCLVASDVGVAPEKGKKLGEGIGCADKRPTKPRIPVNWEKHDAAKPYHGVEFDYRLRPVLQLSGIIEDDTPLVEPTAAADNNIPQAGPSRKRNQDVIDIDDDEDDQLDAKPDNKDRMQVRLGWLEKQLQTARNALKRRRIQTPGDCVDLTGDD